MSATLDQLDERDAEIFSKRFHSFQDIHGPRVGDYVRFADGVERRISHIWFDDVIQTSDGGSFYLGDGYVNFSGGLYPGVKRETLTYNAQHKRGSVWFFHHDHWGAGRGVSTSMDFRVYECSEVAPR